MAPPALTTLRTKLLGIGMLLSLAGTSAMAIEEPGYEVVATYPDFELRRYASFVVAETEIEGDFDEVGKKAFRILADYIFGNNSAKTKMEMTAPVSQRHAGGDGMENETMTPVAQRVEEGDGVDTFVLSFVMPSRYTLETLPAPVDPRIRLREEASRLMAARRYSGRWNQANYRKHEAKLLDAVEAAGMRPIGTPVYARYNSPFSLWFLRRNEVMLHVEEPQ